MTAEAVLLAALRVRDFRLLWSAGLVSSVGSWLLVLAVPAHVFLTTGSVTAAGLTQAAEYLPMLALGPVAGVFADRWDRRRLMVAADVFRAGAVGLMLLGVSPGRYWVLYVALVAESSGTVVFTPALQARTPQIVGTGETLNSANALTAMSSGVVRLIGGPLGGVLLSVAGFGALVRCDAASYLVSALLLVMTSHPARRPARSTPARGVRLELAQGLRAVRHHQVTRALLAAVLVFLAANAALSAVLIPFGVSRLGGSRQTGLLLAALGAGYLIAGPAARVLLDRCQPRHLLAASLAVTAAAYVGLFTSSSLATALPAAMIIGMSGSMSLVVSRTALQRVVPHEVLGRVSAVFLAGEAAVTLLGAVAGPALAQAVQLSGAAAISSVLTLAAALLAYLLIPRIAVAAAPRTRPLRERGPRPARSRLTRPR